MQGDTHFNYSYYRGTEITHVSGMNYIIENQKAGPYEYWYQQHIFEATDKGTELTDIMNYTSPAGWIGSLAEKYLMDTRVSGIFEYRTNIIKELLLNL